MNKKIVIVGHIAIDYIRRNKLDLIRLGGPPTYCGATLKVLETAVGMITWVGYDFPGEYKKRLIEVGFGESEIRFCTYPTTRFQIIYHDSERTLRLLAKCRDITLDDINRRAENFLIISPIAGEISESVLTKLNAKQIAVDAQGFLRKIEPSGLVRISFNKAFIQSLDKVFMLKLSLEESTVIAESPFQVLRLLHRVPIVAITMGARGSIIRHDNHVYLIPPLKPTKIVDSTGAGDVFLAAAFSQLIKDRDVRWTFALATAAAATSIEGESTMVGEKHVIYERAYSLLEKIKRLD